MAGRSTSRRGSQRGGGREWGQIMESFVGPLLWEMGSYCRDLDGGVTDLTFPAASSCYTSSIQQGARVDAWPGARRLGCTPCPGDRDDSTQGVSVPLGEMLRHQILFCWKSYRISC